MDSCAVFYTKKPSSKTARRLEFRYGAPGKNRTYAHSFEMRDLLFYQLFSSYLPPPPVLNSKISSNFTVVVWSHSANSYWISIASRL